MLLIINTINFRLIKFLLYFSYISLIKVPIEETQKFLD